MTFEDALCRGKGALFDSTHPVDHATAKKFCDVCPAIIACHNLLQAELAAAAGIRGAGGGPVGTWAGRLVLPKGRQPGPKKERPREHGTSKGYHRPRNRGEKACEPCLAAERVHTWNRRHRAASEAAS